MIIGMPLRPPVPAVPDAPLSLRAFFRAFRTNTLTIWPDFAYRQDYTVRRFLGRSSILLNGPEAIHHVLVANTANYRRSPASTRVLRPIIGNGLVISEGDNWKLQRRTIAPALAPRVMPMLARHIVSATDQALTRLASQSGEPVNLLLTMQSLALDIAGRSMFSLETDRFGDTMRGMLEEYAEHYAQPRMLDMLLPLSVPAPTDFGRARFNRRWMALVETILARRLATPQPETPRDLFDLLRAARDPETGAGFTPDQLRDQVATLILAGHETTGVTLFWALIMLAEAQDEQDWLAEEAAAAHIEPETAHATSATLTRARAVANEAMRMYPAVFMIVREAIIEDRIGDLRVPKRSVVMVSPWVVHRHHELWQDPGIFRPARFMPDQPAPPRFAFMPFGAGPRICVGAQFAMTELVLVLSAMIGRFRLTRVDTRPVVPTATVTIQPDHAAHVRLTPRASPSHQPARQSASRTAVPETSGQGSSQPR